MWKASQFQVVWFPSDIDRIEISNIYKLLTNKEPDGYESHKVPNPNNPFLSRAYGEVNGRLNNVHLNTGRIDWFFEPVHEVGCDPYLYLLDIVPNLEYIRSQIQKLDGTIIRNVTRISVVSTIIKPMSSFLSASKYLTKLCRIDIEPKNLHEFSLQVNRRKLVTDKVEINRLVRFFVEENTWLDFQIGNNTTVLSTPIQKNYATKIILDFNTVPTGHTYNTDEQRNLFNDLLNETVSVANKPNIIY